MIIAIFDEFADPCGEWFSDDSIDHVYDPLSWQTMDVSVFWEVLVDLLNLPSKLQNRLNLQSLVHWNVEDLDVFGFDN